MNRFFASFKDKRFRYGSFSTVMMLFAIAIFVFVNLIAGQFNVSKDLTSDKMYSLSKYSKEFLVGLEQDVTVYALFQTGQEDLRVKQLLEEYATYPRVNVEYRDPVLYPAFVEQYVGAEDSVSANSVIVVSGNKSRVVSYDDMYPQEFDYEQWSYYVTSIDIEPQISKAIHYVTTGEPTILYHVTGSNEAALPDALVKQFEASNFIVGETNPIVGDIPEDCDILVITTPERDWSTDEADRILKYLQSDGNALFVMGYRPDRFPNMESVLDAYGVRIGDYVVLEGDSNYHYPNNPYYLIPRFVENDITQSFLDKSYYTLQIAATGIEETGIKKVNTKIEPLVVTSNAAYGKRGDSQSETINKEPGDPEGPFNLAVAITDSYYTDEQHTTKLAVFGGGESILSEDVNNAFGGTNWDLLIASASWMQGDAASVYIPSKSTPASSQLQMTQSQANMIALFAAAILPLAIFAVGLVIWFRRRHN